MFLLVHDGLIFRFEVLLGRFGRAEKEERHTSQNDRENREADDGDLQSLSFTTLCHDLCSCRCDRLNTSPCDCSGMLRGKRALHDTCPAADEVVPPGSSEKLLVQSRYAGGECQRTGSVQSVRFRWGNG